MTTEQIITRLLDEIESSSTAFNSGIPEIQQQIADDIALLIKQLDTTDYGTLKNNIYNLRLVGKLRTKIESIVLSDGYIQQVDKFIESYEKITELQNKYFKQIDKKFTPKPILDEIKIQSIGATVESLTEAGLQANITEELQYILRDAIIGGQSYKQLGQQVSTFLLSEKAGSGALERYTKQITTDALNQYSAQYSKAVSSGMAFQWFMYVGSNRVATRPFCRALEGKKYVHISELKDIVKGRIDEKNITIYEDTGVWAGGIPDTNIANFQINRGGYNCNHQLLPVDEISVPLTIRNKFKQ